MQTLTKTAENGQNIVINIPKHLDEKIGTTDRAAMQRAYIKLFAGLSRVNWSNKNTLGRSWQSALNVCEVLLAMRARRMPHNPALIYMFNMHKSYKKHWSRIIMFHRGRDTITSVPKSARIEMARSGNKMINEALSTIDNILMRYNTNFMDKVIEQPAPVAQPNQKPQRSADTIKPQPTPQPAPLAPMPQPAKAVAQPQRVAQPELQQPAPVAQPNQEPQHSADTIKPQPTPQPAQAVAQPQRVAQPELQQRTERATQHAPTTNPIELERQRAIRRQKAMEFMEMQRAERAAKMAATNPTTQRVPTTATKPAPQPAPARNNVIDMRPQFTAATVRINARIQAQVQRRIHMSIIQRVNVNSRAA